MIKILSAVALSSLICLLAFQALAAFYRMELARHREQCRCLAMKILEARLSRPLVVPIAESAQRRVETLNPAVLSGI